MIIGAKKFIPDKWQSRLVLSKQNPRMIGLNPTVNFYFMKRHIAGEGAILPSLWDKKEKGINWSYSFKIQCWVERFSNWLIYISQK